MTEPENLSQGPSEAQSGKRGRTTRRWPWYKKLGFGLLPLVTVLLVAELTLRIIGFSHSVDPQTTLVMTWERGVWEALIETDYDVIYRFQPATRHVIPDEHGMLPLEGFTINERGYRGENFPQEKIDPDSTRVLAYGDSVTFGIHIPVDATIPALLKERLVEDGYKVEILNLALPSYTSTQSLWDFEVRGLDYDPDMLILHLACWNDFSRPENKLADHEVRRNLRRKASVYSWLKMSRVGQFLIKQTEKHTTHKIVDERKEEDFELRMETRDPYATTTRRVPIERFKENVQRFLELAREHDLSVLVVVPAEPIETQNNSKDAFVPYHAYLRSISENERVQVVDLRKTIQPIIEKRGDDAVFIDFVHYNREGCALVAEALEPAMKRLLEARGAE